MPVDSCRHSACPATHVHPKAKTVGIVAALSALLTMTLFGVSCSSVSGQNAVPAPTAVGVQISPPSANIAAAGSIQFNATVTGSSDVAVVWSATQGTITSKGFYLAPKTVSTKSVTVTATSTADPTRSASATVEFAQAQRLSIVSTSLPGAQAEINYSANLQSTGGNAPYTWSIVSGSLPAGLTLSSSGTIAGVTSQSGTFSFSAKVVDTTSQDATTSLKLSVAPAASGTNYTGYDGPAQLPLTYLQTAMADTPAPGSIITVNAGGDLQSALDTVQCGQTIQLQAGAVFSGNFTVPAQTCDDQHWIVIRTSTPDAQLPPEGTRMTPCYGGVASLPARPAYPCSNPQKLLATIELNKTGMISGPIQFLPGASHYRLVGLEITRLPGIGSTVDLMAMQDTTKGAADHIILDRSWVHGTAQDETRRGFALGSMSDIGIVDSYFNDFHCTSITGTCTDSSAIGGGGGGATATYPQAVWKIDNNFLEAAGECILFGGAAAAVTPSDIEIRFNHFYKPPVWMKGTAGFVGAADGNPFVVKNHFEMKNGIRVLLEGNIFENNWGGFTQNGHSIVLTPRNHYDGSTNSFDCTICQVTDITMRYNTISHVGAGMNISDPLTVGQPAAAGGRYSIHDITIDDVEMTKFNGGGGLFLVMNEWDENELNNVQITHITGFPDPNGRILAILDLTTHPKIPGFVFTDNIINVPILPVFGAGGGSVNCDQSRFPLPGLESCFTNYTFSGNVLIASPANMLSEWPAGNQFPASDSDVGFVSYNNGIGGNYALSSSSPYKSASGPDPGADINAINAKIAGVY